MDYEAIRKACPPMTKARYAARQRAVADLDEKYPGRLVGYIDTWTGDDLERVVVVTSTDEQDFQDQLRALPPEVRRRVEMTDVPGPGEVISLGGADYQYE